MFSLLSPFALWLAPLVAVPLAIALMGRSQPKTRDFPSLLPVQATLQAAMKRHRLKNWLQLILRTLALLCLLFAAAGPVWRGRSALPPPAAAALLIHNGAYARIPLRIDRSHDGDESTIGARQNSLRHGIDSLVALGSGRFISETILTEDSESRIGGELSTSGLTSLAGISGTARYGSTGQMGDALTRLLQRLTQSASKGEAVQAWVPAFAARDLAVIASAARPWLEANPGARLIVVDHQDAASRLKAFGTAGFHTGTEANNQTRTGSTTQDDVTLTLSASLNSKAQMTPVWSSTAPASEGVRDVASDLGGVSIALPIPDVITEAHWIAGTFALAERDPARRTVAFPDLPVALRVPPPSTLCHLGSQESYVSLASLGEGGARLKIVSLKSASATASTSMVREGCNLLYLADPPGADAVLAARAVAILRTGGTVILEAGPRTDAVLWNRALLAPLDAGLLTVPVTTAPRAAVGQREALSTLGSNNRYGARADRWGAPGTVTTAFGFRPATATRVLLATADSLRSPLLVERRVGSGRLLLWTTSLSDPAWSTIGLGPWAPLLHQAAVDGSWSAGLDEHTVDTDSLTWWPSQNPGLDEAPRILDPQGTRFTRVRAEPNGWNIGPFDAPGLYRIESGTSTGWLAVTVADAPPAPTSADWEQFEEALGPQAWARTIRHKVSLDADDDWRNLYGGVRLRLALLLLAALLLFAEGVVSLRLAHGSRRESSS